MGILRLIGGLSRSEFQKEVSVSATLCLNLEPRGSRRALDSSIATTQIERSPPSVIALPMPHPSVAHLRSHRLTMTSSLVRNGNEAV
jgi:hypothetical protein